MGRLATRADDKLQQNYDERGKDADGPVVLGSGNLGLLYLPEPVRLHLGVIAERWPGLVTGLCAHPGVEFVAGVDADGQPWALGASGRRNLATDEVEGTDPLARLEPHAARVLRRAVLMPEAPDLYVNSVVDPVTLDVAAFEGLVGAHGGLGGWQDRAVLLVPDELVGCVPERVEGADVLHQALVRMLRQCGHRRGVDAEARIPEQPGEAPVPVSPPGTTSRR